jgi:uncharacterized protein YndB with AHSA1/START domain
LLHCCASLRLKDMLLKILVVFAGVLAVVLLLAATRPKTFRIQRSLQIQASPETVFALIDDFHQWRRWAPQDRDDPSLTRTFAGVESGVGAASQWQSTGSAGKGKMTIVESVAPARIVIEVEFVKPLAAHNRNEFTLEPAGGATNVTWRMEGSNVFVMRVMGLFMNMDKMLGKHFEAGLRNLKAAAEGGPARTGP